MSEFESRELAVERRESDVKRREAVLEWRETALDRRIDAVHAILIQTDQRNATSDARDAAADKREKDLDLAGLLAPAGERGYGGDWPDRRNAALDRLHSRADRAASHDDLMALTEREISAHPLRPGWALTVTNPWPG